jgi:hypothetical protein
MPDSTAPADHGPSPVDAGRQGGLSARYLRNRDDPKGAAERARQWAEQNAEAIRAYNAFVEEHGVVGDDLRSW